MVLLVFVATACRAAPTGDDPLAASHPSDAVRRARAVLTTPLEEVGWAVLGTQRDVTSLRLGTPLDPAQRLARAESVGAGPVQALGDARARLAAVELPGGERSMQAAREAVTDILAASDAVAAAARADLALIATLAAAEVELAALAATWDEPGSRSRQLQRLSETREAATAVADRLDDLPERPACGEAVARRVAAARAVAAASAELHELVAARRGDAFDQRRAALGADPYGLGTPELASLDAADRGCVEREGEIVIAVERFDAALDRLVASLNPPSTPGR